MATKPAAHIAKDTYKGVHLLYGKRHRGTFTARQLATMFAGQAEVNLWEYFRTTSGADCYQRTRLVPQEDGSLMGYDSDGARKYTYGPERRVTILTK